MGATNSTEVVVEREKQNNRVLQMRIGATNSANVVVERAKQIIIQHFPEDIYHITFNRREGKSPKTEISIFNKDLLPPTNKQYNPLDFYCIECEILDNNPSILHIGLLSRCGLRGTTHLEKIIDFAKECRFSEITLEDASTIVYTKEDDPTDARRVINLAQLTRLMTGRSWYEKFGFTNDMIDQLKDDIKKDIDQPISIYNDDELIIRIQDMIETEIEIEIEPTIPIKEAASYLYQCLEALCPKRKCRNEPDVDTLDIVKDINSILDEMYISMLSRLTIGKRKIEKDHFYDLHLTLRRPNQMGSSRKTRRNKKAYKASRSQKRRTQRRI
jgi:hypothetical protein